MNRSNLTRRRFVAAPSAALLAAAASSTIPAYGNMSTGANKLAILGGEPVRRDKSWSAWPYWDDHVVDSVAKTWRFARRGREKMLLLIGLWAGAILLGSWLDIGMRTTRAAEKKASPAKAAPKEGSEPIATVEPLWQDDFNSYEPRWNWRYCAGSGFKTIRGGILEAGVTDKSNRQVYSDCSLHEANLSWKEGIVEMRLRYCAGDIKAGSMGWGFWTGKPWPMETVTAAWFLSVSPPSDPEIVTFRAMVVRNGVYLLNKPLSVSLEKWHTYRVEMTSAGTRFFIDGKQVASCQESPGGKHRVEIWVDNLCVRKVEGRLQRSHLDVPEEQKVCVDWVRFFKVPGKK
jgi:hypothetical protein